MVALGIGAFWSIFGGMCGISFVAVFLGYGAFGCFAEDFKCIM